MRAGRAGAGRADNSKNYVVYGSLSGTTTTLTLNTALGPDATQANVDFTVSAGRNTVVQVNAGQAWAGTTTVNSGAFTTANGITLASSAIVVGGARSIWLPVPRSRPAGRTRTRRVPVASRGLELSRKSAPARSRSPDRAG